MTKEEFNKLKYRYNEILKRYSFLSLSEDEQKQLFIEAINSIEDNDTKEASKNFNKFVFIALNKIFLENDEIFINTIDDILGTVNNYQEAIIELEKLENFSRRLNLKNSFAYIAKLINSSQKLNNLFASFINESDFNISQYYEINNNDFLTSLTKIYCDINNVKQSGELLSLSDIYTTQDTEIRDVFNTYAQKASLVDILTKEEEIELARKVKKGDKEAEEILVERNILLVLKIAGKIHRRGSGFDINDLIQEGMMGLSTAIKKFDPELGFKFSTYATPWIEQYVRRFIENNTSIIRIPVHRVEDIRKLKYFISEFQQKNDYNPSIEELVKLSGMTSEKVQAVLDSMLTVISGDSQLLQGDEKSFTIFETTPDDNIDIEETVFKDVVSSEVPRLLKESGMQKKEIAVIIHRFGLIDNKPKTLELTGDIFAISRERVRQIEIKALRILRHNEEMKKLRSFITTEEEKNPENRKPKQPSFDQTDDKPQNLFEILKTFDPKEVYYSINLLDYDKKYLLYKKFGKDLSDKTWIAHLNNNLELGRAIKKLKHIIHNNRYGETETKKTMCLKADEEIPYWIIEMHRKDILQAIPLLKFKDRPFLLLRLGFVGNNNTGKFYTVESIAKFMGTTYEVAKEIIDEGLSDLNYYADYKMKQNYIPERINKYVYKRDRVDK